VPFAESDADVVEHSRNLFRGCRLLRFSVSALVSIQIIAHRCIPFYENNLQGPLL